MKKHLNKIALYIEIIALISTLFIPFICVATSDWREQFINYHAPISFIGDIIFDTLIYPYGLSLILLFFVQLIVRNRRIHFIISLSLTNISFFVFILSLFPNCLEYANALCIITNILIFLLFVLTNLTFIYSFINKNKESRA